MTRLLIKQRQRSIADLVLRDGQATIDDLVRTFGVSPATIRRDLNDLQTQGIINRSHGGAVNAVRAAPELPLSQRSTVEAEAKRRIGEAAAALVPDGATVFISSGTTPLEVARALAHRENLTVITNALNVANLLVDVPGITLVVVGGVVRRSELALTGHLTDQALSELGTDFVFIGAHALSVDRGLTADDLAGVMTDRAILQIGQRRVVVADHTKFGKFATARVVPLMELHTIVTDAGLDPVTLRQLRERGIEVITA
jgi:DeoR family fructose operon transcriptional repressor